MQKSVISKHGLKLLTLNSPKTVKGESRQWVTGILYLAPSTLSGFNVCPKATPGCIAACLNTSGHGAFASVQAARIRKTRLFYADRESFMATLVNDLELITRRAESKGYRVACRLNGTSDIIWHRIPVTRNGRAFPSVHGAFPRVQFYEYTKQAASKFLPRPNNLHVTFSRSESNDTEARRMAMAGFNVAVVFDSLPAVHYGLPVHNGDSDDLRFLDPAWHIIGLKTKGRAKRDDSGFVVRIQTVES